MGYTIHEAAETSPAAPAAQAVPAQAAPVSPAAPGPAETIVRAAMDTGSCVGPSGRTYTFKRIGPLDRMLVAKAIGGELMANALYCSFAMVACSVTHINGVVEPMPASVKSVEARVQRIGDDWDVLNAAMKAAFYPADTSDDDGEEA